MSIFRSPQLLSREDASTFRRWSSQSLSARCLRMTMDHSAATEKQGKTSPLPPLRPQANTRRCPAPADTLPAAALFLAAAEPRAHPLARTGSLPPALAPFQRWDQAVPSLSRRCRAQPALCRRGGASRARHRPHQTHEVHLMPNAADIKNNAPADHHRFRGGIGFARGREWDNFAWHTT